MHGLIYNIFIVVVGAAGIIKISEDPLRTGYTLILVLVSWEVLRNYIRQYKEKNTESRVAMTRYNIESTLKLIVAVCFFALFLMSDTATDKLDAVMGITAFSFLWGALR